jgi:hypothetical protein
MEAEKAFVKEVMAEITDNHTYNTLRLLYVIRRKGLCCTMPTEIRISTTLLYLLRIIENGL